MIWIDSSFAVEWLLGTDRAREIEVSVKNGLAILPAQYAEILAYFMRKTSNSMVVIDQLEALDLEHPDKSELQLAAQLYDSARRRKSKASLADAILAAVAESRGGEIFSFDDDFRYLGFTVGGGVWTKS